MAYQWRTNSKGNVGSNAGWLDLLNKDWAFVKSGGGKFFLYWHSDYGNGTDWRLTRAGEQEYYRTMAAEGRPVGS